MKSYQDWKNKILSIEQANEHIEDYTKIIDNLKALLNYHGEYLTQSEQEEIKGTIKILSLCIFNLRRGIDENTNIKLFLTKNKIPFELGQVKGGFESITVLYKQRAEFIEYLRKNRVKVRDIKVRIDDDDNFTSVTIIFEKESKL